MPVGEPKTMDHNTRQEHKGEPSCKMRGPQPETTQDRTEIKDTHPIPTQGLNTLIPPEIEPGPPDYMEGIIITVCVV